MFLFGFSRLFPKRTNDRQGSDLALSRSAETPEEQTEMNLGRLNVDAVSMLSLA